MRVRQNRVIASLAIGAAALNGISLLMSGSPMALGLLVVFGALGVLMFVNPVLVLEDRLIRMQNLFGVTLKTYEFDRLDQVCVEGGKLFVDRGSGREQVKGVSRFAVDPWDWQALVAQIERGRAAGSAER